MFGVSANDTLGVTVLMLSVALLVNYVFEGIVILSAALLVMHAFEVAYKERL